MKSPLYKTQSLGRFLLHFLTVGCPGQFVVDVNSQVSVCCYSGEWSSLDGVRVSYGLLVCDVHHEALR